MILLNLSHSKIPKMCQVLFETIYKLFFITCEVTIVVWYRIYKGLGWLLVLLSELGFWFDIVNV